MAMNILTAFAFTYFVNIPFGYWRQGCRKFSKEWFISIHLPVPIIVFVRLLSASPLSYIPLFFMMFFAGQYSGGFISRKIRCHIRNTTKCIFLDFLRLWRGGNSVDKV
jgi:hypothetical protein